MKSIFPFSLKIVLATSWLGFFSCGSENTEETNADVHDTLETASKDTGDQTQDFFYSLPSPLMMVKVFKKTGLKYMEGVANSPDNVSRYSTTESKTLNLG